VLVAPGCTTSGISLEDLPDRPIALTYWKPEAARRRLEALLAGGVPDARAPAGFATEESLFGLFGLGGDEETKHDLRRWPGHLALLDPGTRKVAVIESAPAGARALAWSSGYDRLLFASGHQEGRLQLYEYSLASKEVRPLTYGRRSHLGGAYGPGGRLVYSMARLKHGTLAESGIFVTAPGGGPAEQLEAGFVSDSIQWSRDGATVVYTRYDPARGGRGPVLVARAPTPGAAGRTLGPGRDPVFSPDGEWIIYTAPSGGRWRLRRIRPDGSARSVIGRGVGDELMPAVSPDGRYVAYVTDPAHGARLHLRRLDGSGDRVLLESGSAAWPVW
jgi:Tol biopolymer transport system component